jgi:NAD(P)H-hydrate epimerase
MAAEWLRRSDIVIDALLGTGSKGAPREPMARWIEFANSLSATRVAIDLPSGLDADSGVVSEPTFRADLTLTMASQKIGFINRNARPWLGEIMVLPIGLPVKVIQDKILSHIHPRW